MPKRPKRKTPKLSGNVDARSSSFNAVSGDQVNLVFNVSPGASAGQTTPILQGPTTDPHNLTALDLLFLQDSTASQQPYIKSAVNGINKICNTISSSVAPGGLRVGLIAFRDHPPQDLSFVTKNFGFTSDITVMQKNLQTLVATGGGDGPEAQTAALSEALNMGWRDSAIKIVVLITDAPPHGIGEENDGFPAGSPDQNDPLVLARMMADKGITLFLLACEPSLSMYYQHASDFYRGLVEITSGMTFPLVSADHLADYIIGTVREACDIEAVVAKHGSDIANRIHNENMTIDDIAGEMTAKFQSEGMTMNTFTVENIYTDSSESLHNKTVWGSAKNLAAGRALVKSDPEPKLLDQFSSGQQCPDFGLYNGTPTVGLMRRVSSASAGRKFLARSTQL